MVVSMMLQQEVEKKSHQIIQWGELGQQEDLFIKSNTSPFLTTCNVGRKGLGRAIINTLIQQTHLQKPKSNNDELLKTYCASCSRT